jgi:hypothetical protein
MEICASDLLLLLALFENCCAISLALHRKRQARFGLEFKENRGTLVRRKRVEP